MKGKDEEYVISEDAMEYTLPKGVVCMIDLEEQPEVANCTAPQAIPEDVRGNILKIIANGIATSIVNRTVSVL